MRMIKIIVYILALVLCLPVWAATYTLPQQAGTGPGNNPFNNCSFNGIDTVSCPSNVQLPNGNNNDIEIDFAGTLILQISGDLTLGGTDINVGGVPADITITVAGNLNPGNSGNIINANITVSGNINSGNNTNYNGGLVVSGNLNLGNNSNIDGDVVVSGTLNTGTNVTVNGNVDAGNINFGQNNEINGDVEGDNININGGNTVINGSIDAEGTVNNNGTVNGNINADGTVNNNGTVDGYINAPEGSNYGDSGQQCDVNDNEGGCFEGGGLDHFEIVHDGNGLTCLAESITLRACEDAACSTLGDNTGTFALTATQGSNQFTTSGSFPGTGSITVNLAVPLPETYTLSLTTSDTATNPTECDLNGNNNCQIVFTDTGFILNAPTAAQAGVSFNLTVQAVRTDNNTGACAAALDGNQTIQLGMECTNPANCLEQATSDGDPIAELPSFTTLNTTFSGGIATIPMVYPDAGAINFSAQKTVATNATLVGSLDDDVIVRPFAFVISTEVAADVSSFSADYSLAPKYKMAGESFPLAITAVNFQGTETPNYGNESPQQMPQLNLTPNYVAPTGAGGVITLDTALAFEGSGTATYSTTEARYSDIGIIEIFASQMGNSYLGSADVTGTSVPTGRFYPAYFTAGEVIQPLLANAQDDFTYVGQPLVMSTDFPELVFVPRSVQGTPVTNYRDDFFKYTPDWSLRSYTHSTTCDAQGPFALTGFGASNATINSGTDTDVDGEFIASLTTEAGLTYVQDPAVYTPPFQACAELTLPAASLTDSDDVCVKTSAAGACLSYVFTPLQGTELLDGRLRLLASYGPANDTLELDFTIEYFDGAGFVNNIRDDSTLYSDVWMQPEATRFQNFVSDESLTAADLEAQTLVATAMNDGTASTLEPLLLGQTAVEGLSGTFDWILNLNDIGLPWLQFNWDDDCSPAISPELNPCAPIEFGVFRGNDRIIYQRELGW